MWKLSDYLFVIQFVKLKFVCGMHYMQGLAQLWQKSIVENFNVLQTGDELELVFQRQVIILKLDPLIVPVHIRNVHVLSTS